MARPSGTAASRRAAAYDAGRRGEPAPVWVDSSALLEAYDEGLALSESAGGPPSSSGADTPERPAGRSSAQKPPTPRTGSKSSRPTTSRRGSSSGGRGRPSTPVLSFTQPGPMSVSPTLRPTKLSASDGAGFLLGLWLYALGLSYLREGPAGPRRWMAAKFLNKTSPMPAGPPR
jgi:hypothetical protein